MLRGQLRNVSRGGLCLGMRTGAERDALQGASVVVRFWADGRAFSLPATVVWCRSEESDDLVGVKLDLRRAQGETRDAFERWAREIEETSMPEPDPQGPPISEQVECRLAALFGSVQDLVERLADGEDLDERGLVAVDRAAEALQNACTALQLRKR